MKKVIFGIALVVFAFGSSSVLLAQKKKAKSQNQVVKGEDIPLGCYGYIPKTNPDTTKQDSIYVVIEQMPEFVGGMEKMYSFIQSKIIYPKEAIEKNKGGKAYIQFIVEKDGSHTQHEVVRGLGYGLDEVALNAVKQMPNWIPGKHEGKTVRVKCIIPVEFIMEKPKKRYVH